MTVTPPVPAANAARFQNRPRQSGGVAAGLAATLRMTAEGEIAPKDALTISDIIDLQRRAVEMVELGRSLIRRL